MVILIYNFTKFEKPPIVKLVSGIISGFRTLHLVIHWILQLGQALRAE